MTRQIALLALKDALANRHVREEGDNGGKAVETYLASVGLSRGNPWCAAFVYYRLFSAAATLGLKLPAGLPKSGYCPTFQTWAKKNDLWQPVSEGYGRPGDLGLLYFPKMGRVAHIGIVVEQNKMVEGNTGPSGGRDGDGVYLKTRKPSSLGARGGFIRLDF